MAGNGRLSAKQERAILELANPSNRTVEDVAKKIGVGERTLYRWLTLPHFEKCLSEEREKLRDQAFSNLKARLNTAVERLGGLLDSETESIKLRASQAILDYNIKIVKTEELEERLKALEEALERRKNGGRF
ncbi:MAG: phBC6A51 family helix-turn-helix protein [Ignavibacteriales bacterium]